MQLLLVPFHSKDAGTPIGGQTISVSAADSGSGPAHNFNIQLIVQ